MPFSIHPEFTYFCPSLHTRPSQLHPLPATATEVPSRAQNWFPLCPEPSMVASRSGKALALHLPFLDAFHPWFCPTARPVLPDITQCAHTAHIVSGILISSTFSHILMTDTVLPSSELLCSPHAAIMVTGVGGVENKFPVSDLNWLMASLGTPGK